MTTTNPTTPHPAVGLSLGALMMVLGAAFYAVLLSYFDLSFWIATPIALLFPIILRIAFALVAVVAAVGVGLVRAASTPTSAP